MKSFRRLSNVVVMGLLVVGMSLGQSDPSPCRADVEARGVEAVPKSCCCKKASSTCPKECCKAIPGTPARQPMSRTKPTEPTPHEFDVTSTLLILNPHLAQFRWAGTFAAFESGPCSSTLQHNHVRIQT